MGFFPVIIIGNSYRKQLFLPFKATRAWGRRPHLFLPSEKLLNAHPVVRFIFSLLISFSALVVVSDAEAAQIIKTYVKDKNKKIFWIGWNAANEAAQWPKDLFKTYPNLRLSFMFSDCSQNAARIYRLKTAHFKFPVYSGKKYSMPQKFLITYLGEVELYEQLEKENKNLDDFLWEQASQLVLKFMPFPTSAQMEKVLADTPYEHAVWVLRNRMRFKYVSLLKSEYGSAFALYGNDWKKYGLESFPAEFDPQKRYQLYSSSRLCLDLLSKSSFEVHYPRSAEIISHSNGIIQPNTAESLSFFAEQTEIRTFGGFEDLKQKINRWAAFSPTECDVLGQQLRDRLEKSTKYYNLKQQNLT